MLMIRLLSLVLVACSALCIAEGTAYCSRCNAVDCNFDTQCGPSCTCVKLNGNIKGQCVEKY